jgi:hypothetical protein
MSWEQLAFMLFAVIIAMAGIVEMARLVRRPRHKRLWLDEFDRRNNS